MSSYSLSFPSAGERIFRGEHPCWQGLTLPIKKIYLSVLGIFSKLSLFLGEFFTKQPRFFTRNFSLKAAELFFDARLRLLIRAQKIERKVDRLQKGLTLFGSQLLAISNNFAKDVSIQPQGYCRAITENLIQRHLIDPNKDLCSLVAAYEEGADNSLVYLQHSCEALPLIERERIPAEELPFQAGETVWDISKFKPGVYSVSVFVDETNRPCIGHLFAFFKSGDKCAYFEPSYGLIAYDLKTWQSYLNTTCDSLRKVNSSSKRCLLNFYRYKLRPHSDTN